MKTNLNFVWNLNEKEWNGYWENLIRNFDCVKNNDEFVNMIGLLGCCNVGELCFDIRGWGDCDGHALGYELFCGGVDTGYNYTDDGYPYDEVGYDEFGTLFSFLEIKLDDFKKMAEKEFEKYINEMSDVYKEANLIDKANTPLHVF